MKRKDRSTKSLQRRRYDADFKVSAVQMLQNGQSVAGKPLNEYFRKVIF